MSALNKIMLIGNLCRDMERRNTPSGQEVSSNTIAVTERFKDKNGQQQEKTEFINLVFWRRQSKIACQYAKKGSSLYVEGKIETQTWEKEGVKQYKTQVVVSNFQFLGSKGGQGGSSETQAGQQAQGQTHNDVPPPYDTDLPF